MNSILIIGNGNVAWHFRKAMEGIKDLAVQQIDSRAAKFNCENVELVIIAVKDIAIQTVAEKITTKTATVVHTSGFTDMEILSHCAETYGVIYPLQTLKKGIAIEYGQMPLCIEAKNERGLRTIKNIAQRITSQIFEVSSAKRKSLHLAATFANNFTNHMLGIAKEITERANLPFEMLFPLIDNTISEIKYNEPYDIQTGVAVRNDETTIEAHRKMLNDNERAIYDILTKSIKNKNKQ
ncbi:MAG: DUF2520 domain-containing protein [Bacteroidales bacterium]|jgi:predicted short-subunit dehydrogenase-like oxidoreductase (DUF2520 family)|nr:DUF2520 domain-containing protein [Bacteroidales bacterium]